MLKKITGNKDLWAVAIFFLLAFIFFAKGFLQNQIIWGYDTPKIIFPLISLLDEAFKQFRLPLWTPDIFLGFPIGAEGQIAWFYPFSILYVFLPFYLTFSVLFFLHVFAAGVFTYFFARTISLNRFASVFTGIAFMFSGFIIARMQYFSHIYAYAYLPLILLFIELAFLKKSILYFVFAGAVFGLQLLSGHPNIPAMTLIYAVSYCLIRSRSNKLLLLKGLLFLFGTSVLIALPQLLLTKTLVPLSIRSGGVDFSDATNSSLSFFDFITFLFPNFYFADSANWLTSSTWHFFGYWGQIETTGYIGIITLFFIPFSLFKRTRKKAVIFFVFLFISLLLALGKNTPIYKLLMNIPVFNGLRAPGRFLFLIDFSLAILAGLGITSLFQSEKVKNIKIYIAIISISFLILISVTIGYLFVRFHPEQAYNFVLQNYSKLGYVTDLNIPASIERMVLTSFQEQTKLGLILVTVSTLVVLLICKGFKNLFIQLIILTLIVADLFTFSGKVNVWKNLNEISDIQDPIINKLHNELTYKNGRIYSFNEWSGLMPDQLMLYHIPEANGFASLPLKRFENWQRKAEQDWGEGKNNLFRIGSIRYTYNINNLIPIDNALPRAYVTNSYLVARSNAESFDLLTRKISDIRTAVVESGQPNFLTKDVAPLISTAKIEIYQPNYVKISSETAEDGLLVLTDTNFPGWEAFVNGKKAEIYQTNYLFRGVLVTKGLNKVEFRYNPAFLSESILISFGTCLVVGFLILRRIKVNL